MAGTVIVAAAVAACATVRLPAATDGPRMSADPSSTRSRRRLSSTLVMVFAVVALEFSMTFWLASYLADDIGVARRLAATMVGGLYAANLAGRLLASRLARHLATERILAGAITLGLAGLPVLLAATDPAVAALGLSLAGIGVGATFPLTSSLHVGASARNADSAIGHVLATAAIGQILGPLAVAVIAQAFSLRTGLLTLPALALIAAGALCAHTRRAERRHPGRRRTTAADRRTRHPSS